MIKNLIARNARGEAFHLIENGKPSAGAFLRFGVDTRFTVDTNREGEAAERVRLSVNGVELAAPAYRMAWPADDDAAAQATTAKVVFEQLDAKGKPTSIKEATAQITDTPAPAPSKAEPAAPPAAAK